jgi:phenylpropionate dioxygenase-like ring-hydroxylating dioxygenase large terminal subunit
MIKIATWSELREGTPHAARAAGIDLVVLRVGEEVRVLHGRCPHRGAPMAEGTVVGEDLMCRRHGWSFRIDTGESPHIEGERLCRFAAAVDREADAVCVDEAEIQAWIRADPQAFGADEELR